MNILPLDDETMQSLVNFTSIEEMNEVVKEHKQAHDLSTTDREILHIISQYACKYIGVCYLSKQKIAETAGFTSRRTAIRACNRLEQLGVIKQYETRRVKGDKRRSVNIIVIQRMKGKDAQDNPFIKQASQREVTGESHTKEALHQSPNKAYTYKETWEETEYVFKKGLKRTIPEVFYHAFSPFFNARELYDIYGILLRAKATVKERVFSLEDKAEEYIDYFYNVIRLYKWGKVANLKGYLFRTWEWLSKQLYRQEKNRGKLEQAYHC
ncbi:helix-turn-helix domain-containing protein [Pseudogracilibacillus sp. ICA-222130]|uniref:helix-turn-helix domain-containing protein n=1 Tax=Pseudogracilibacillus sp. ICA-222130 TaxID=3134655 RepID=UPI0030C1F4A1